jgi:Ca2+-binding RTX toxin-like protein
MAGGTGDDLYVVDHAGDRAMELNSQGRDTVLSAVSYNLGGQYIENLALTGTDATSAIGNSLHNTLTGNAADNRLSGGTGNDSLIGGAGHDTLDGGAGADTMAGGTSDDLYVVDHAGDRALELHNQGTDTVLSAVSYNLGGQYIENLTLTGTDATSAIGNSLHNTLTGNAGDNLLKGSTGNDSLVGGAGHDTLDGGAGADTMAGGTGDDLYVVDHAGDRAMELNSQGTDTVLSAVSYNLGGQYIENLTLTGTDATSAIGNSLNNTLTGNAGDNRLSGGTGNDSLIGGAGHDLLDGGAGADTMAGGTGDDLYVVDHAGDRALELNNQGRDTVLSAVSYNLGGQFIEILTLTGTGATSAIGNSLNNLLTGNAAANLLNGGTGTDTLNGAGGDDVLTGGAGADTFLFGRGAGSDLISDFTPGTDHIRLSGLGFGSFAQVLEAAVEDGGTTVITLGAGDLVMLRGVALASLSAGDFLFG